jgi:hypothetical protein
MSQEKTLTEKIGGAHKGVHAVNLRNERFVRVEWFLENQIPMAELTLLNGDGGLGKTTAILDLLARASSGQKMPCGLQHTPMKVLILAEEDRRGLIRARLDVAKANHDNIRLIDSAFDIREKDGEEARQYFTFPTHAKHLYEAITAGGFEVVFIDAIANHYDDDIKANQPQDMRRAYRSISEAAHEAPAVVIASRHITKGAGPASMRGSGSLEARNLCRSELTVGMHPDRENHPGLRVIALSKSNLSSNSEATTAFRLESHPWKDDDGRDTTVPLVRWSDTPPSIHADELVKVLEPKPRRPVDDAADWLKRALSDGPKPLQALQTLGKAEGYEPYLLYRARKQLRVYSRQEGKVAYWSLDEQALKTTSSSLSRVQKTAICANSARSAIGQEA